MTRVSACTLQVADQLAYLMAARQASGKLNYVTPGRKWLAAKTGYSIRTISRAIAQLQLLGWAIVRQRSCPRAGVYRANIYWPRGRLARMVAEKLARLTKKVTVKVRAIGKKKRRTHREPTLARSNNSIERVTPLTTKGIQISEGILDRFKKKG